MNTYWLALCGVSAFFFSAATFLISGGLVVIGALCIIPGFYAGYQAYLEDRKDG